MLEIIIDLICNFFFILFKEWDVVELKGFVKWKSILVRNWGGGGDNDCL